MTEADEVAAALIPFWFKSPRLDLTNWVRKALPDESETVISNVIESLNLQLLDYREDGKLKHRWMIGQQLGFKPNSRLYSKNICRECGVLRGPIQYPETPCKGKIKVTLRNES